VISSPSIIVQEKKSKVLYYKTTTTQSIAPTMTLAVKVKSLNPDLVIAGVAPEEPLLAVPVAVEPEVCEPEVDERAPVDVAEAGTVLYKSVLLNVVQELVAGITGLPPGGFWLSPSQTENSLGLYDAGILKLQPCVSKMF